MTRGRSHYQNEGPQKIYGGNAIWNKYVEFFSEDSYSFRCFQSDGEFIPDPASPSGVKQLAQVFHLFHTSHQIRPLVLNSYFLEKQTFVYAYKNSFLDFLNGQTIFQS